MKNCIKVNITLPKEILDMIDNYCEKNGSTRSGFLSMAAKQYISAEEKSPLLKDSLEKLNAMISCLDFDPVKIQAFENNIASLKK